MPPSLERPTVPSGPFVPPLPLLLFLGFLPPFIANSVARKKKKKGKNAFVSDESNERNISKWNIL